jgi:hypothetical protein
MKYQSRGYRCIGCTRRRRMEMWDRNRLNLIHGRRRRIYFVLCRLTTSC